MSWICIQQFLFAIFFNVAIVDSSPLQAYVHKSVMEELKRIIDDSEITKEDDALWPPPDRVGRQVSQASQSRISLTHTARYCKQAWKKSD